MLLSIGGIAQAQVIQPPPRSTAGLFGGGTELDPNRTYQQFSTDMSLSAGYDHNLIAGSLAPADARTTTVAGGVRYWRGRTTRSLELSGNAFLDAFPGSGVEPVLGGIVAGRGATRLFDRSEITVRGQSRYSPATVTSSVTGGPPDDSAAPIDPTLGVLDYESLDTQANSSFSYEWSPRQRSSAAYLYANRNYTDDEGRSSVRHLATFGHAWRFTRNVELQSAVDVSNESTELTANRAWPLESVGVTTGLEVTKRVSRTRRLVFGGRGGVARVNTLDTTTGRPVEYFAPQLSGDVRFDLGQTWALSAEAQRDASSLGGLSTQSFLTTTASLWLGGSIGRRLTVSGTASYSGGDAPEGQAGSFSGSNGTLQMNYSLFRCCSLLGSYSYYTHRLQAVASTPDGFPNRFRGGSFRIGMTAWLPLYGPFPDHAQPLSGRN
jgi:hypothetical protein